MKWQEGKGTGASFDTTEPIRKPPLIFIMDKVRTMQKHHDFIPKIPWLVNPDKGQLAGQKSAVGRGGKSSEYGRLVTHRLSENHPTSCSLDCGSS
ncbi:MAG: hypothetical protein V3V23_03965 [Dehalococcoidales bacterium]